MHILRCMGSKFCVKFQRAPLKFYTKFWTHTPQNVHFTIFIFCVRVTISLNCDVISLSETGPWLPMDRSFFHLSPRVLNMFTNFSLSKGFDWKYRVIIRSARGIFKLAEECIKKNHTHLWYVIVLGFVLNNPKRCGGRQISNPGDAFYYMMTSANGNIFRVTGHLCGEYTGPRWMPRTKASDAELWCFLWSAPE